MRGVHAVLVHRNLGNFAVLHSVPATFWYESIQRPCSRILPMVHPQYQKGVRRLTAADVAAAVKQKQMEKTWDR
jgi:hypothetical protein